MYKPITINTALLSEEADSFVNKLDPNKVFKSKNKTPVLKKKQASQPPGSQKSHTSMTSAKTSSLAGNSSRKWACQTTFAINFDGFCCRVSVVQSKFLVHECPWKTHCSTCMKYSHDVDVVPGGSLKKLTHQFYSLLLLTAYTFQRHKETFDITAP